MTVCTQEELARCLDAVQKAGADRVILTIAAPLAVQINRERLIQLLDLQLVLCQGRTQVIRRERDGRWYLNLRLHYRCGLHMAKAWRSGDLSALSDAEKAALHRAEAIAAEICAAHTEAEAQVSAMIERLHQLAQYENPPRGTVAHGQVVHALSVLSLGRANCQGFSDALYLLCSLTGIRAEYRLGFKGKEMHLWNGVMLRGTWKAADATSGMLAAEEEMGLFLIGRLECDDQNVIQ